MDIPKSDALHRPGRGAQFEPPTALIPFVNVISSRSRKPRLLFVARYFAPHEGVVPIRTESLAYYLVKYGWDVEVLTVDGKLVRNARYKNLERLTSAGVRVRGTGHWLRFMVRGDLKSKLWDCLPFTARVLRKLFGIVGVEVGAGWVCPALKACGGLQRGETDVVLATGPPFMSFLIAARVASRLGVPYVLDYRDPWTASPHRKRRSATVRLERKLVREAASAMTVSPVLARVMEKWLAVPGKFKVVTNGYDPEALSSVQTVRNVGMSVVYAGNLYPPSRCLLPVFKALRLLVAQGVGVTFDYYGLSGEHVARIAQQTGVQRFVAIHGRVSRREALAAVKAANLAVVITSVHNRVAEADLGIVTGKLYELLGLRIPILLVAPPKSDARDIVEVTQAGQAFSGQETDAMASYMYDILKGHTKICLKNSEMYSWPRLANRVSGLLGECLKQEESQCH